MSVVSPAFFALVALTALLLAVVPPPARRPILLLSTLVFYLSGNLPSALLGLTVCAVDYLFLRLLLGTTREATRDRIYWGSIAFNLLAFLSLKLTLEPHGAEGASAVAGMPIAYPLGFSFIILMLHSALSDAYSGRYEASGRPANFFLFCLFFPYVTSGPVERLDSMERQFDALRKPTLEDIWRGSALIALGLFKKLVVANRLSSYVLGVFAGDNHFSVTTLLVAIALNVVQMYADFSGYTDIARGAARILGIEVRINFDDPFVSRSVTEYWRRWHISFSTWLRDYLYMPMAYSLGRLSRSALPLAIFVTFLVAGFWHRATWTFVIFGFLHGLVLALELKFAKPIRNEGSAALRLMKIAAARTYTLAFIGFALVFFSARSVPQAGEIFARLVTSPLLPWPQELLGYLGPFMFVLMLAGVVLWQVLEAWHKRLTVATAPLFIFLCAMLVVFLGSVGKGFVYEQF